MNKQHFEHHDDENKDPDCHFCQIRSFSTHDEYPIAIINEVDNACLPESFHFIEHSILQDGVETASQAFKTGCECLTDHECRKAGCHCLQDIATEEIDDESDKIYAYHSVGDRKECLRGHILESRHPIYECHAECSCSKDCSNRVVQRGRKIPLQVFRTDDGRGWGVRSPFPIKRGQYVDKYVGEIISSKEANDRRKDSEVAQRKDVYLFALDKFNNEASIDPRLAGQPLEVDGEYFSGPTRFINHSCGPNLRSFARVGDHADKHLHDLALFAIEDIPAGEELTFDYVDGEPTDLVEDSNDPNKKKDMTRCLCRSENCRGYLW